MMHKRLILVQLLFNLAVVTNISYYLLLILSYRTNETSEYSMDEIKTEIVYYYSRYLL